MEKELFEQISAALIQQDPQVAAGKMMSSPAINFEGKVFAFFSRKNHMVFKMGKGYIPEFDEITPFNPFKKKGPLPGWFQIPFERKDLWSVYAEKALNLIKNES